MLEWVHRLIAGVLVGPLVLLLAVLTFRHRRRTRRGLPLPVAVLVLLLLVQGALGGLTVLDRNSPWSVAIHLGNALLVLTVTVRIYHRCRRVGAARPPATACSRPRRSPGVWRCSP